MKSSAVITAIRYSVDWKQFEPPVNGILSTFCRLSKHVYRAETFLKRTIWQPIPSPKEYVLKPANLSQQDVDKMSISIESSYIGPRLQGFPIIIIIILNLYSHSFNGKMMTFTVYITI